MRRLAQSFVAACALLAACGPSVIDNNGDGGGNGGPHELSHIEVTPVDSILELDLNAPGTLTFQVYGKFLDGVDEDWTDRATLTLDNAEVGGLNTNVLEVPARTETRVDVGLISASVDAYNAQAQVTVVAYRRTGPNQDFFFVLPYNDSAGEQAKPLEFGTAVPAMDVFFLTDVTGSMGDEIVNIRNAMSGTIVPGIKAVVADTYFGAGSYQDFPFDGYGAGTDQPIRIQTPITADVATVQAGIGNWTASGGADGPESGIEGIYRAITGEALNGPGNTLFPATNVGFRPAAMPVIVSTTDAANHEPGGNSVCGGDFAYGGQVAAVAKNRVQTKAALANRCARVVGVASADGDTPTCPAQRDLEDFSTATGARVPPSAWDVGTRPAGCAANQCCTGQNGAGRAVDSQGLCPLVYLVDRFGTGIGTSMVTGIQMLARFAQFDVTSEKSGGTTDVNGNALPAGHTTADFIKSVTPTGFVLPAAPPVVPAPTMTATGFMGVTPNTKVSFDVKAFNDFVPQTPNAQFFRADLSVLAGGCTPLDGREVLILVPPRSLAIGKQTTTALR